MQTVSLTDVLACKWHGNLVNASQWNETCNPKISHVTQLWCQPYGFLQFQLTVPQADSPFLQHGNAALLMTLFMLNTSYAINVICYIVAPVASNPGWQQLWSAARSDVIVPRSRTKFSSRAFSIAGPEVWNRTVSRSPFGQQILSDSSDDYWKLTTSSCISVLTNSAVIVFNLVFTLHTFYDYCNASRSGFVYRGH